ncbi:MAG TPA: ATP-binding protein [Bryobacteraceae bacterium]|nr:ATP-binding protein [Bryobacteraceae bacterium]
MNSRSIRFRLTAAYAATLAFILAVAGAGVLFGVRNAIEHTIDQDLRARVRTIRSLMADAGPAHKAAGEEILEQAPSAPGGLRLRIASGGRAREYNSPGTTDWPPFVARQLPARGKTSTIAVRRRAVRTLVASVPSGFAEIGVPVNEFDEMEGQFRWTLILASPLLLGLASAAGYWMSGRALKPVDEIAQSARRIGGRNLSERLYTNGTGDELDRLAETLNEMLARLEAAFQKITQFTADASHELRTPVAIMRTTAEVIIEKPRNVAEHEKGWEKIVAQTERTSHLIDDLLLLARADAGRDDLQFEVMDLAEVLTSAGEEMQILAEVSGLRLSVEAPEKAPMTGDPEAIRRLLRILLDNAIKYTPAQGEIALSLEVCDRAGTQTAVIRVRDTGAGIAAESLPYIFDRFYRTSRDRSRTTGGAGLGLSIAQWIAARHGGKLLVESSPGVGSTFSLVLNIDRRW